jgi:hypothetical protein
MGRPRPRPGPRLLATVDYTRQRDPSLSSLDADIFSLLAIDDDETFVYVAQRDSLLRRSEVVISANLPCQCWTWRAARAVLAVLEATATPHFVSDLCNICHFGQQLPCAVLL